MSESWKTRLTRVGFNFFPAYRGSGGRLTYVSDDWREVRLAIPLSWRTRNYVGTTYGGSIYGAIDPVYMIMLIKNLGPEYVVWDKAASIRFLRPGRETLFARFLLPEAELTEIRRLADSSRSLDRVYRVEVKSREGALHATVEKAIYIARKDRPALKTPVPASTPFASSLDPVDTTLSASFPASDPPGWTLG